MSLRDTKRRAAGGKKYWAEGVRCLGVEETAAGLRFRNSTLNAGDAKGTKAPE
jgi:hypothetical protein